MFLPRYAKFHLARAGNVALPGGVPVLSGVGGDNPPDVVLRAAGLDLVEDILLNAQEALRRQVWARLG
jgi:hypothetical protein